MRSRERIRVAELQWRKTVEHNEGREGGRDQTIQERCRPVDFQTCFAVKNPFGNLLETTHMLMRKDHTPATLACNIRSFTAANPYVHPNLRLGTSEKVKTIKQS